MVCKFQVPGAENSVLELVRGCDVFKKVFGIIVLLCVISGCAGIDIKDDRVSLKDEVRDALAKTRAKDDVVSGKKVIGGKTYKVELRGVNVTDFVDLVYGKIANVPYVIDQGIRYSGVSMDIMLPGKMAKNEVVGVVGRMLERMGYWVDEIEGVYYINRSEDREKAKIKKVIKSYRVKNGNVKELSNVLKEISDSGLQVKVSHDDVGHLIFTGEDAEVRKVMEVVKSLDRKRRVIHIDVRVISLVMTGNLKYGLAPFIKATYEGETYLQWQGKSLFADGQISFGLGIGDKINAVLDLLEKRDYAKTVSAPYMMCTEGRTCKINVGVKIPVLTTEKSSNDTSTIVQTVSYQPTGIVIDMIGKELSPGRLSMLTNIELSEGESNSLSKLDSPSIINRTVSSDVILKDGQVTVIAGLYSYQSQKTKSNIPGIKGMLDILGNNSETQSKTEIVILIKPRLIEEDEEMVDITIDKIGKIERIEDEKRLQVEKSKTN